MKKFNEIHEENEKMKADKEDTKKEWAVSYVMKSYFLRYFTYLFQFIIN